MQITTKLQLTVVSTCVQAHVAVSRIQMSPKNASGPFLLEFQPPMSQALSPTNTSWLVRRGCNRKQCGFISPAYIYSQMLHVVSSYCTRW